MLIIVGNCRYFVHSRPLEGILVETLETLMSTENLMKVFCPQKTYSRSPVHRRPAEGLISLVEGLLSLENRIRDSNPRKHVECLLSTQDL